MPGVGIVAENRADPFQENRNQVSVTGSAAD